MNQIKLHLQKSTQWQLLYSFHYLPFRAQQVNEPFPAISGLVEIVDDND